MQSRSNKRQKELAREQRQRDKNERRQIRKREKAEGQPRLPGEEDSDIAGIVPGPQPQPDDEVTR